MENENISSPEVANVQEERLETTLRPQMLDEYIGQTKVKESMKIYIEAAKKRNEPLDHCLFYGPPGLGKTTISGIIANEMHSKIRITSGPAIEKPGDLAGILTSLEEYDVLFIDEIHRLSKVVEEILYPALEDFVLDITIGKGPEAKSIRLDLPKFTLIGAFLGAFLYCLYIVIKYLMDDTIHTAEDMEKYFDIVPLAVIPDIEALQELKEYKKAAGKEK